VTDRELLEMAAKAAGIEIGWIDPVWNNPDAVPYFHFPNGKLWNPLTDDGDALRLAVAVSDQIRDGFRIMLADFNDPFVAIDRWTNETTVRERTEDSGSLAATRRAIVRAAAAIGESMS